MGTSTTGPGGPYTATPMQIPVGTFAHNPQVVYSPKERRYLLFVLGYENRSTPLPCDSSGSPDGRWGAGIPPWLSTVSLHVASRPQGPWSAGKIIAHGLNAN